MEVFGELGVFEDVGFEEAFLLEGGDVFADAVVEDGIVALGNEFVYFGGEKFDFAQLEADGFAIVLGLGGFKALQLNDAVVQAFHSGPEVLRFEFEQAVSVPFVNDDVGFEALVGAAA